MATVTLGNIKFNWKGAWNSGTAYVIDDVVSLSGSSYVSIQAGTNQNPASASAYWQQMSAAGTDGTDVGATLNNKEIAFKTNAGAVDGIPIGTAGQFLKVNSGATGYEYGAVVSEVLGSSFITYGTRFTGPTGASSGTGYSNTVSIYPSNTWQYTKTIQNSHLVGWLVICGIDGGSHEHGRGTLSFSIDGSTLTNKQTVATAVTSQSNYPNHSTAMFKVANNVAAGTITIDARYGGNGSKFWEIINPNSSDHQEYDVTTASHMFIMEVAN
jgi:hypothetical protein